ncbi:uncharacterized protein LOC110719065 [Chenopodium quinoa]|uniref:uncharacterized protein LOC110719065 n=1 Tax=Chenopodium quinoa TaxID=63459 RepID=UPI000B771D7D|nr:uncharacterized protein LOC110719065 [Chenopodium quinoa]
MYFSFLDLSSSLICLSQSLSSTTMEPQTPSLSFDLLLHNRRFPFPFLSHSPSLRRKQRRSPSPSQSEIGRRQFEPNTTTTTTTTNLNQLSIQSSQFRGNANACIWLLFGVCCAVCACCNELDVVWEDTQRIEEEVSKETMTQ